ncbi:MAG: transglycosylase SLT domain-containing protein [Burkholderiales bacterium]
MTTIRQAAAWAAQHGVIRLAASAFALCATGAAMATLPQASDSSVGDPIATVDTPFDATPRVDVRPPVEVREIQESVPLPSSSLSSTTPTEAQRSVTDLWERVRNGFTMSNLATSIVTEREAWYAAHPAQLRIMTERSRRYLFHIVEELEKRGMPTELALLPMVESAFNPMAYSRAHASGLWQFIPSTGKNYNLTQNWWYDARRDVVASTTAALDYLQMIYEMHGDWHLALASYNWGENAVARAVERNKRLGLPTDYDSLPMPRETRYYVPSLQALKNIIANPAAFGVALEPVANAPYFATVTLTRDIDVKVAARLAEMPIEDLVALNAGHNRPMMSSAQTPTLALPADRLDRFLANIGTYDKPLTHWRTYDAKRGERLEAIASNHGLSLEQLRRVNGIRGAGRLRDDVELLVPTGGAAVDVPAAIFAGPAMIAAEAERVAVRHAVRAGESWAGVARRYGVAVGELRTWNNVPNLVPGRQLTVFGASATAGASVRPVAATVIVRPTSAKAPVRIVRAAQPLRPAAAVKRNANTRS